MAAVTPARQLGEHLSNVYRPLYPIRAVSARGSVVTTDDGRDYVDFTTGAGVANTGHCHPRVVEAIQRQVAEIILAPPAVYAHAITLELAAALAARMPPSVDRLFFTNSGAESLEAAVKVARRTTGRPNIIVFEGGFHGRTGQTLAMSSSKASMREGYTPLPAGVHVAPYPYWYRTGEFPEDASQRCLEALRRMLLLQTAPTDTAAVVIEPVLGEGGYVVPPPGFLAGVQAICLEHGLLLVCDEVQSGVGRTGRFLALEHDDLEPDIVCMAKGLGSGLPIGAIAIRREIDERWPPFTHGSTFGGSPVAAAAALATLQVIDDEGLLENATNRGEQLRAGLRTIAEREPGVGDVRGRGLMNAIEIVATDGAPDAARTAAVIDHCFAEAQILLLSAGPDSSVIRFIPPLDVTSDQIEQVILALEAGFAASAHEPSRSRKKQTL